MHKQLCTEFTHWRDRMLPVIETNAGAVQGKETEKAYVFKAVPYAMPPVGDFRFKPPQPTEHWEGVRVCDHFPPMAVQRREEPDSFYGKEFFSYPEFDVGMSEDCLYLNLWTPKNAENCPVAIWYHGGGFQNGNGAEPEFDGEAFSRRGVIFVTVNYRLGFLGWFCHPELRFDGVSGNWGLRDQIAALDWVRENIASFGGNPENITIFGQSAGGMAVRDLVCSPYVKGKISHAIIQSCNGHKGALKVDFTMEKMERISEKFLKRRRMTVADLEKMPAEAFPKLQWDYNLFAGFRTRTGLSLTPVIDGRYIPMSPDKAVEIGETARISYMTGSTRNDMAVSKSGAANVRRSKLQMSLMRWSGYHTRQGLPSYSYRFERQLPGDNAGAFHSSELWYVFGSLGRSWRPMGREDYALSEQMTDAWADFMKTGSPGWEPCDGEAGYYKIFDVQ